jgi:hypothetical protein
MTDANMKPALEASTGTFDILLEFCRPDLYRQNAFRVTGLPVDVNARDISRHLQKLQMIEKLGGVGSNGAGMALYPLPDITAIRDATQRLHDPERRMVDELFWFWPHKLGESGSDEAMKLLATGDVTGATIVWTRQERDLSNANVSTHNLAVYRHAVALDLEWQSKTASLTEEEKKQRDICWQDALKRWHLLLEHEGFWSRLTGRIRDLDDPRLTTGTTRRMRKTLPQALLSINAHLAVQYAEQGHHAEAKRHINLMRGWNNGVGDGDSKLTDEALQLAVTNLRNRLKTLCRHAESQSESDPVHADEVIRHLLEQSRPLLTALTTVLPDNDLTREGAHDEVAQSILTCQIKYGRKTEDWETSQEVLEQAELIANGESVRVKIRDNIKQVKELRESGNNWCSSGYWALPSDTVAQLEEARTKAQARDYDGAIQDLAGLDPQIGKPLCRALGYCLSLNGIKIFNDALDEHKADSPQLKRIIHKIKAMSDTEFQLFILRAPTPSSPSYLMPECPSCGSTYYSRWVTFKYKEIPLFMCSSCSSEDQSYIERQKSTLREYIKQSLEYIILADEIDPGDSGVQRNLQTIRKTAADLNCSIHSTVSLKKKFAGVALRGRQEVFPPSDIDEVCYFCGTNRPVPSCHIKVPMSSRPKKIMLIFGEGEEHSFGDIIIPRCEICHDQHKNLPSKIEQWHQEKISTAAETNFPAVAKEIEDAKAALCSAESAEASARDLANFSELAAEESALVKEVARQQALLDQINTALANARNELNEVTSKNIFIKIFKRTSYQLELSQAQAKLDKLQLNLTEAEKSLRAANAELEASRQKIKAAQDEAVARAQEVTKQCSEALAAAQNKMHIAQEGAMKAYEEQTPCPTLPSGIEPELTYTNFSAISAQLKRGWHFGRSPRASAVKSDKPVNVSGLVGRSSRIASRLDTTGVNFYYQHPGFKAVILPAVTDKDVLCLGTIIHDIDISKLMADGTIFANYQSIMTSPSALIVGRHVSILRAWIKAYTHSGKDMKKAWKWLYSYLIDNNEAEARSAMEQMSTQFLDDCHVYFAHFIMHDESLARRLITQFEANASNTLSWIKCAKIWELVFCDEQTARKCLSKATAAAKDSFDWNACANEWIGIFQDVDEALRCIAQAEKIAQYTYQWLNCAHIWLIMMNDEGEARRCLKRAIECGNSFESCAQAWLEMFDDVKEAQRCIEKAETDAEKATYPYSHTWTGIAAYWQKLGNDKNATRCIRKSETIAEKEGGSLAWHYCAIAWQKVLGDNKEARRCMQKVESCAKGGRDWTWCAKAWAVIMPDAINARQCLDKAVSLAKSAYDWNGCAEIWRDVFSDEVNTKVATEKATALAEGCFEWKMCAELWLETFGNISEARRCVVNMESTAQKSYDWRDCASFWDKLGDTAAAARCREFA